MGFLDDPESIKCDSVGVRAGLYAALEHLSSPSQLEQFSENSVAGKSKVGHHIVNDGSSETQG